MERRSKMNTLKDIVEQLMEYIQFAQDLGFFDENENDKIDNLINEFYMYYND